MWKTVASVVVGGTALAAAPLVALPALGFGAGGIVAGPSHRHGRHPSEMSSRELSSLLCRVPERQA